MITVDIQTTDGKKNQVNELELQRAIINYLRSHYPDRQKIIAEETNVDGLPVVTPAAVMFVLKNPHDVVYYTDIVTLEQTPKNTEL